MAEIRNQKLKSDDYEFVGENLPDREMVWIRIDEQYWRVLEKCGTTLDSKGRLQRVFSRYRISDRWGSERYIAIAELSGFVPGIGPFQEDFLISGIEWRLEDAEEAQRGWIIEREKLPIRK